jgi:hypothetical protein
MDDSKELTASIQRIAGDQAVVEVSGQTITWPASALPDGVNEGDTVRLRMLTTQQATNDRHEMARAILEEILGAHS